MGLFDKAKEIGNDALDATKKMGSGITNKIAESFHDERAADHTMYELFVPGYGLGVKFAFTESSVIYGKEEYPYAELDPIQMINPATRITNGTAQTRTNGKVLTLAYESDQSDRFVNVLSYANGKIKQARGIRSDGEYQLYTSDASRLEVHNGFLVLYSLSADAGSFVPNTMGGGAMGKVIRFSDIEVLEIETGDGGKAILHLRWNLHGNESEKLLPLNDVNAETAEEIIGFVRNYSQKGNETASKEAEDSQMLIEGWDAVTGKEWDFQFMGRTLHVSKERDLYNTYRLRYAELYARVQPDNLFRLAQNDYFCLVLTLASILGAKKMDALTEEAVAQAQGIFENLSNPNFPKEKKPDMMLYILQQNPYNEDYHRYLAAEYGATAEIREIAEYFGFSVVTEEG